MTRRFHETKRANSARQQQRSANQGLRLPCLAGAHRRALLAGTALASTLMIAVMAAPTPASAVTCVGDIGTGPAPISHAGSYYINCVNTEARTNAGTGLTINLRSTNDGGGVYLNSSGTLTANFAGNAVAIGARSSENSYIDLNNAGDIFVNGGGYGFGIYAIALGNVGGSGNTPIDIVNSGDITATGATEAIGIGARTVGGSDSITITNSGDMVITNNGGGRARGISGLALQAGTPVEITNSGTLGVMAGGDAFGIYTHSFQPSSPLDITNTGEITVDAGNNGFGIYARVENSGRGTFSPITINNSANLMVTGANYSAGIYALSRGNFSPIDITNSGDITATANGGARSRGIDARSDFLFSDISIVNSGDVTATDADASIGISGFNAYESVRIENLGSVYAQGTNSAVGFYANSVTGSTIINSGDVTSSTLFAIDVKGTGAASVYNSGTITGFVDLTDQDDMFVNQAGGLFEARLTSDFGTGNDSFTNAAGGTVRALNVGSTGTRFDNLTRFDNRGTISMLDGAEGDSFTIANTPGGTGVTFSGAGGSRLAVDAFLGAPGSTSDTLTIEGNVTGRTEITVNNTNAGGGALNQAGIPVVFATGTTPGAGGFFLDAPIEAGFFDYDLFFVPGDGRWELRSSIGAGAQVLPQLLTASHDIWYQSSSVWFDRSADLRVLLARGNAPAANLGSKSLGAAVPIDFTPAVWVRGSAAKLDRDGDSTFTSFGRSVSVELERELETADFQMGLDLGQRNLLSQGDILVFGMLGGFVHGDLDYEGPGNDFDFTGGQVGAYATYLKGGLFVDTLFNAHFYELDANGALGYPNNDLDANTLGLRTDAGYRFGSFSGGAFLEPLATIAVTWADIDDFTLGGNTVRFDNDANVRGRLGLRAGTSVPVWDSTIMEPFVTGSLWGHLAGDNQATLISGGQTFRLEDNFEDVWGEVSAGVNFFNFSETTSVFAKVDVTFGDDVSGVGGKAGMRVAW